MEWPQVQAARDQETTDPLRHQRNEIARTMVAEKVNQITK